MGEEIIAPKRESMKRNHKVLKQGRGNVESVRGDRCFTNKMIARKKHQRENVKQNLEVVEESCYSDEEWFENMAKIYNESASINDQLSDIEYAVIVEAGLDIPEEEKIATRAFELIK